VLPLSWGCSALDCSISAADPPMPSLTHEMEEGKAALVEEEATRDKESALVFLTGRLKSCSSAVKQASKKGELSDDRRTTWRF
jgi:hypothetical protein